MNATCLLFTLSTITSVVSSQTDTPFTASRFIVPSTVTECASAPLYLWTLWCYTNAVIIIMINVSNS